MRTKADMKFPDYNFNSNFFNYKGNLIHYIDTGKGEPIVLLHGNPTWSFLYRKMIPILAKKRRVIVPDLIGFGLSAKPHDKTFYTFENHLLAISALLDSLKLKKITLVGQDWGGPIISNYAIRNKLKIKSIILMNTYLPGTKLHVPFYFSILFRQTYSFILIQNFDIFRKLSFKFGFFSKLPKGVREAYFFPHKERADRLSIAVFPKLIPLDKNYDTYKYFQQIDKELMNWHIPKLLIFSDKDLVFNSETARELGQDLPNSKFILIRNAGHFLQEDKGEDIAIKIVSYLSKLPN